MMAQCQPQQQEDATNVSNLFQTLNINEEKDINILLLGPRKSGKSTFANALANYLTYRYMDVAENEKIIVLVPSSYTIIDKDLKEHEIHVRPESYEYECDNASIQTFVLPVKNGKIKLRLVCSAGFGNASNEDEENEKLCCEDLLSYIAQIETLHAVCCILPADDTINLRFFDYCFKKVLPQLSDDVYKNLVFVFTHSHYKSGTSLLSLKKLLNSVENNDLQEKVVIENKNVFYFENNSFVYLAAQQNKIEFDLDVRTHYTETWRHSAKESHRFIAYITGNYNEKPLPPYSVSKVSKVLVRWSIIKLLQPIVDILDFIKNNLIVLEDRLELFKSDNLVPEDVEGKLNIPGFTLKVTGLPQPVTMCANSSSNRCAIYYTMGNVQTWQMQRCCECCYLKSPPRYLIGDPSLLDCEEMDDEQSGETEVSTCRHCGCNTYDHMHVYYLTKIVETIDKCDLSSHESLQQQIKQIKLEIESRIIGYQCEMKKIVETAAEFVHFLRNEAIAPYDDPYEVYIQYLIKREETSGNAAGEKNVENMETFLQNYQKKKGTLTKASDLCKRLGDEICLSLGQITPEKVNQSIDFLYSLKHTGLKIKELVESQNVARTKEYNETITELNVSYSKGMKPGEEPGKHYPNRRNRQKDNADGFDGNQRGGRGSRGRGNRSRRGRNRGDFRQNDDFNRNCNMPPTNTDPQPPPYSKLYPNQDRERGNSNTHQQNQQRSCNQPYVQINVINDPHKGNQQRGYKSQNNTRGFKDQHRGGGNRQSTTNKQNDSTQQRNIGSREPQNLGANRQQRTVNKQQTSFNQSETVWKPLQTMGSSQHKNAVYSQQKTGTNQQQKPNSNNQQQNDSRPKTLPQQGTSEQTSNWTALRAIQPRPASVSQAVTTQPRPTLPQSTVRYNTKNNTRSDKKDCIVM